MEYLSKVREKKFLTQHVTELTVDLALPDRIRFEAGQFMEFVIGGELKAYSITSIPVDQGNKTLSFCVQMLPDGVGSNFVRSLEVGNDVRMRGPFGSFTFKDFGRNAFFVATGVGIAPFVSIIPDALSHGFGKDIRLLFGVRHEDGVFYFDKFNHLAHTYGNFSFTPIISQPQSHWPGEVGRVTTYLDVAYEQFSDCLFYVCGDKEPVQDIRDLLLRKGHPLADIRMEVFV